MKPAELVLFVLDRPAATGALALSLVVVCAETAWRVCIRPELRLWRRSRRRRG